MKAVKNTVLCAGCGIPIPLNESAPESLCLICKKHIDQLGGDWEEERITFVNKKGVKIK